jgi:hypothetical protein
LTGLFFRAKIFANKLVEVDVISSFLPLRISQKWNSSVLTLESVHSHIRIIILHNQLYIMVLFKKTNSILRSGILKRSPYSQHSKQGGGTVL